MQKINIEYFFDQNRGYIFLENNLKNITILKSGKIILFKFNNFFKLNFDKKFEDLLKKNILCGCAKKNIFIINKYNRLPSERWEEHIDSWSCHKNEFDQLLKNQLLVRKYGILYSHFYFLVDEESIPNCCIVNHIKYYKNKIRIIYFNEILLNFNYEILYYYYFKEYFAENDIFSFKNIEIKYFGSPVVQFIDSDVFYNSIKIGYKILSYEKENQSVILNDYFYDLLIEILQRNNIENEILSYKLSYFINLL